MLTHTMLHSLEEERMLAALQEKEEQLMSKAEKLWKKIAEVWQGITTPESNSRSCKWEAMEEEQQHPTWAERGHHPHCQAYLWWQPQPL